MRRLVLLAALSLSLSLASPAWAQPATDLPSTGSLDAELAECPVGWTAGPPTERDWLEYTVVGGETCCVLPGDPARHVPANITEGCVELSRLAPIAARTESPAVALAATTCQPTPGEALYADGFRRSLHVCYPLPRGSDRRCTAPYRPESTDYFLRYGWDDLAARGLGTRGDAVGERFGSDLILYYLMGKVCGGETIPWDKPWLLSPAMVLYDQDFSLASRGGVPAFDVLATDAPPPGGSGTIPRCTLFRWEGAPATWPKETCETLEPAEQYELTGCCGRPDGSRCIDHPACWPEVESPTPPPPPDPCGDGRCDGAAGETHASCPADCNAPEPAPPPGDECDAALDAMRAALESTERECRP